MNDQVSAPSLADPEVAARLRRMIVQWTLRYWAFMYVFLTIRSVAGGRPFILISAVLRIPMMVIGLSICAAMFILFVKIDHRDFYTKLTLTAVAVLLGTLCFSVSAYVVYYVLPQLWPPERSFIASIATYMVTFLWIFAAWALIFHYLRHRVASGLAERTFVQELWERRSGRQIRIPVRDIEWIESEGDYARVHTRDRSHLLRATMQRLETSLDPDAFVRIHRRSIVAREAIASIRRRPDGGLTAQLRSGASLAVGRNYATRLKPPGASRKPSERPPER